MAALKSVHVPRLEPRAIRTWLVLASAGSDSVASALLAATASSWASISSTAVTVRSMRRLVLAVIVIPPRFPEHAQIPAQDSTAVHIPSRQDFPTYPRCCPVTWRDERHQAG